MNEQEAIKLIKEVLFKADGGCPYCVGDMLFFFGNSFPEWKGLAEEAKEVFRKQEEDNWRNE